MAKTGTKLRFKDEQGMAFPEWEVKSIGMFLEEYSEKNSENHPVASVGRSGVRPRSEVYSKELSNDYSGNKVINKDTMTIGMGSKSIDLGFLHDDISYAVSPAYSTFKVKNTVPRFLEFALMVENPLLSIRYMITGARQGKSVDKLGLLNAEIRVPSLPEQQKIADFLSALDARITDQRELVELLEKRKQGMLQRVFSQQVRFVDEEGQAFPEWEEKRLSDVSQRVSRKNINSHSKRALTISGTHGIVDQIEFFSKNVSSKDMAHYTLLKKGEFAYNKSYSNGYPFGAIKPLERYEEGAMSPLYICFAFEEDVHPVFYKHYFSSVKWHREIAAIAVEGARNHGLLNVPVGLFFNMKIESPVIEEQQKIADFFTALDEEIDASRSLLNDFMKQKQAALQGCLD